MVQRMGPIALAALSCALAFLSERVLAFTSETTSPGCFPSYIGDGDCDLPNDNEDCGYDGGDCCECTCVSTEGYTCGENDHGGYSCLDPSAPCVDDDFVTTLPTTETICADHFFADGDCDTRNNQERCDYDGGDCCECTCVSTDDYTCGDPLRGGFECVDPSAPCFGDDDDFITLPTPENDELTTVTDLEVICVDDHIKDGACDSSNNNQECDYDGGDCCECTCVSTDQFTCGDGDNGGFDCADPNAPCFDNDTSPGFSYDDMSARSDCIDRNGHEASISDGHCDSVNNNEECGYDGGDCCECTCVSTDAIKCGVWNPFNCLDPEAPCVDDDDVGAGINAIFGGDG